MTSKIALLFNISKSYDRQIAQGVVAYCRQKGWTVYLEERPEERLPLFKSRDWDGLIADLDDHEFVRHVRKLSRKIPIVGCGGLKAKFKRGLALTTVDSDEAAIAKMAVQHLVDRGYQHLAFCSVEVDTPDAWHDERKAAFLEAAMNSRLEHATYTHKFSDSNGVDAMVEKLGSWLRTRPKPCGIMASNDPFARHVLEACRQSKIAVPDEVGVIGVDNSDLFCELTEPPLTSIQLNTNRIGFELARQLDRLIKIGKTQDHAASMQNIAIPPQSVIIRASTDLAFSANPNVSAAIRIIRSGIEKPLSVKSVCRALRISRSKLDTEFRETLGRTVHDEIARRRLEQAAALLRDPSLTILEISQRCGFSSSAYFIAVFKKQYGVTPNYYRSSE
jgi:LacI family transcriptional regulator